MPRKVQACMSPASPRSAALGSGLGEGRWRGGLRLATFDQRTVKCHSECQRATHPPFPPDPSTQPPALGERSSMGLLFRPRSEALWLLRRSAFVHKHGGTWRSERRTLGRSLAASVLSGSSERFYTFFLMQTPRVGPCANFARVHQHYIHP